MTVVLVLGSLPSGCRREPQLSEATVRELYAIWEESEGTAAWQVRVELDSRPLAEREAVVREMLLDVESDVRCRGVAELGSLVEDLPEAGRRAAVELLVERLEDPDRLVRITTIGSLTFAWLFTPSMQFPERLLPALRAELRSPERDYRLSAVATLHVLRSAARPLAGDVLPLTHDSDPEIREWAAGALGLIDAEDPVVVARLTEMLADSEEPAKNAAAGALGLLGAKAEPAYDALLELLTEREASSETRYAVADALTRIPVAAERADVALSHVVSLGQAQEQRESWEIDSWIYGLGRLAARTPGSDAGQRTRDLLVELCGEGSLAAPIALAEIAASARDEELLLSVRGTLDKELARIVDEIAEERAYSYEPHLKPLVETAITLLSWPEAGVDPAPILVVLDACAEVGRHLRDWSAKQRARLP